MAENETNAPRILVATFKLLKSTDLTHDGNVVVLGKMTDGSELEIFSYYNDELTFTEAELVGKTKLQANRLKLEKDEAYLKS